MGECVTYAHVQRYRHKHRLLKEHLEWSSEDFLQALPPMQVLCFQLGDVLVVSSFLPFSYGLPLVNDGGVCFRYGEKDDEKAESGKHRQNPEQPPPAGSSDGYEPADHGS